MKLSRSHLAILSLLATSAAACGGGGGGNDNQTTSSGPATTGDTMTDPTGAGATGGGGGSAGSAGAGAAGTGGAPALTRGTISGDATWKVTFDDTAKAAGATDCSYTRHYQGVEDRSAPWLCPTCDVMYYADVTVTAGLDDCFSQVSSGKPAPKEWIGKKGGTWMRSSGSPTSEQGTVTGDTTSLTWTNATDPTDAPAGGKLSFAISGQFTLGQEEGDPMNGWVPPATYTCGWPKANPPAYAGDYTISKGGELPDGLFLDKCNEVVRLHDFKGTFLVVDMSAMDCPPCQQLATDEEKLVSDMAAQGIEVKVVTLLAPSLSNVFGLTTQKMLQNWTNNFKLMSPVLADRGWGVSIFEPVFADQIGYPSYAVVSPDLKVLDMQAGYGGVKPIEDVIVANKP